MKRRVIAAAVILLIIFTICYAAEDQNVITVSLVGDLMFSSSVDRAVRQYGADGYFAEFSQEMKNSDFVFGNLETCLSNGGEPVKDKQYTFKSSPQIAELLKKNNFTAVSIANNHSLDFGRRAFMDTLGSLSENGVGYAGGGSNKAEAEKLSVFEKNGIKLGFIAFSRVIPYVDWYAGERTPGIIGAYKVHEENVLKLVRDYSSKCDILIVSLHWGKEGALTARKEETVLAHKLVDAGADVIMGHHPHVVQGMEMYKGSPIFYSLGNFAFTSSKAQICNRTVMAQLKYNKYKQLEGIRIIPGLIKFSRPTAMEAKQKEAFFAYLNRLNINFKVE